MAIGATTGVATGQTIYPVDDDSAGGSDIPFKIELTPAVIRVDDDAPLGGDGATWSTAYKYLQDALGVCRTSRNRFGRSGWRCGRRAVWVSGRVARIWNFYARFDRACRKAVSRCWGRFRWKH
ncbi:MAG: hypothetical protein V3W34_18830, partial [Phycisphaerae bacterium]